MAETEAELSIISAFLKSWVCEQDYDLNTLKNKVTGWRLMRYAPSGVHGVLRKLRSHLPIGRFYLTSGFLVSLEKSLLGHQACSPVASTAEAA